MRSGKRALSAQRHRHRRAGAARVKGSSTRWMVLSRKVVHRIIWGKEDADQSNIHLLCDFTNWTYCRCCQWAASTTTNESLSFFWVNSVFQKILSNFPVTKIFSSEILQLTQMCRFTSWVKIDLCIGYKMCLEMFQNIPCTFFHTALKKSAIFGEYWLLKISFCFHWNQPSSWSDLSHNL